MATIQTHIDWDRAYETYGPQLAIMEKFVQRFEEDRHIQLTPGAVELIFVPLIEVLTVSQSLDQADLDETFSKLLQTIETEPDPRDQVKGVRSSLSVIRAFWRNFCNIPPLCSATPATGETKTSDSKEKKRKAA
jgi:hypothetical protein